MPDPQETSPEALRAGAPVSLQSADALKRALPLLARHGSDFGPESYALWFTYVEGTQPRLNEALDALVQDGRRLTAFQTRRLYESTQVKPREAAVARMQEGLLHLVTAVAASTASASASTSEFIAAVQREEASLSDAGQPLPQLQRLLEHSSVLAHSIAMLSAQLTESQAQIARLQQEVQAARREASLDGLTGVANRRSFDRELDELFHAARGSGAVFGVILLDIDHFKMVNNTWGHVFGDRVLQGVAGLLRTLVKGQDLVARYGGEEFAVLLPHTDRAQAAVVAEHMRAGVERARIRHAGSEVAAARLSISCGVAAYHRDELFPAHLVERADAALYRTKTHGRNRVEVAPD